MKTYTRLAVILSVALAGAACDRDNADVRTVQNQAEQQVERTGAVLDDASVTAKVKAALVAADELKGLAIDVDTSANVVTLRGTVASDQLKQQAEQVARGVEGVKDVRNELSVAAG